MELWGLCAYCDRWFYCDQWIHPEAPWPGCPVCAREASVIEDRSAPTDVRQLDHWDDRLRLPCYDDARRRRLESEGAVS